MTTLLTRRLVLRLRSLLAVCLTSALLVGAGCSEGRRYQAPDGGINGAGTGGVGGFPPGSGGTGGGVGSGGIGGSIVAGTGGADAPGSGGVPALGTGGAGGVRTAGTGGAGGRTNGGAGGTQLPGTGGAGTGGITGGTGGAAGGTGGCGPDHHDCGGTCVSNTSVDTCGARCSRCADPPAGGVASCDGTACSVACDPGYRACPSTTLCVSTSGGCCTNDDCPSTAPVCSQNRCVGRPLGDPCTTSAECTSQSCVDNHCCGQSACGTCQACGSSGTCVPVVYAEDPGTCSDPSRCDAAGSCVSRLMEFPVAAASSFNGLASGPDGNIWFSEKANRVGRVAVNGTPAADIMLGNEPETLFVASDRTVWLIESSAGRIVHLSSSGMVLSDFPLGGNIHPQSITVGQDGNVWFTDASSVGRITAAGSPTEYSTPSASALMLDIAAGPAGSLWFTEYNANKIGRIDPAAANPGSTILEYSLPHAASGPEQLVLGADGAIWFTEYDGQRVGRIATGGTITEIDVPTAAGAGPAGITVGPGGDLWITDFADDIVRINSSGVTMTYQVTATGSGTDDIVLGPDGNIWFTEFNTGKLGRFVP